VWVHQTGDGSNLEYGDPGEADVVERDGATVRIAESGLADGVVLVPVDAGRYQRGGRRVGGSGGVGGHRLGAVARDSVLDPQWDVFVAVCHAVVALLAADEVHAVLTHVRVRHRRPERTHTEFSQYVSKSI